MEYWLIVRRTSGEIDELIRKTEAPAPLKVIDKPNYPTAVLVYGSDQKRSDAFCRLREKVDCTVYPLNPAERRFHKWLDKLQVGHVFLDQQTSSFATAFKSDPSGPLKRPDFIILPDGRKPYAVDVKEKSLAVRGEGGHPMFEIDASDIESLMNFQELYHIRVWLALTPDSNRADWYFIDVFHAQKLPASKKFLYIPYTGCSTNSAYREREAKRDKGFFLYYLTKNSPEFIN